MPETAPITTDESYMDKRIIIWVAPFITSIKMSVATKSLQIT